MMWISTGLSCKKTMNAMNGLDEIVELVTDTEEDRFVAMPLEVAPAAGDDRFGGKYLILPSRNRLSPVRVRRDPESHKR
jgi:hypothetical protein